MKPRQAFKLPQLRHVLITGTGFSRREHLGAIDRPVAALFERGHDVTQVVVVYGGDEARSITYTLVTDDRTSSQT